MWLLSRFPPAVHLSTSGMSYTQSSLIDLGIGVMGTGPPLLCEVPVASDSHICQAGWPGRCINVRRCGGLSIVLQLKDPLELFVKSREFLSFFLPRRDMTSAVESDVNPIPSFLS